MPASPRVPGSQSTAALLVRMTPEERARWHAAARSRGTTLAEVARKAWSELLDTEAPSKPKEGSDERAEPADALHPQ